jgi:hypothetical protein
MPNWSTALPPPQKHAGYDLRRTPPDRPITAVITSPDMIVCDTHFWGGRTTPCERTVNEKAETIDDSLCPACQAKHPWRTHAYVAAFNHHARVHFLFECTDAAAEPLAAYRQANGTLRGCLFTASRPKRGKNAKVEITTRAADLTKCPLPPAPNLILALSVIWRLPLPAFTSETTRSGRSALRNKPDRLAPVHNQPDDAGNPPLVGEVLLLRGNGQPTTNTLE